MKTPTLEEVKEYFKNAKEVRCLWDGKIYNISSWKLYKDECGFHYAENKKAENERFCGVFGINDYAKFAEIISYKDTYTVSKDFILEAHESACSTLKTKIENQFPELFPKVEPVTGLFKLKQSYGYWFGYYENNELKYTITDDGFKLIKTKVVRDINDCNEEVKATKEEVETALIAEAKRRGFKKGVRFKRVNSISCKCEDTVDTIKGKLEWNEQGLITSFDYIFYKGVWAEIISEPIELSLEQRLERIEKHLNIN